MKRNAKIAASITTAAILAASVGFAGGIAAPVMEPQVVEEERADSRAGIIVPILALVLLGLAISNDSGGAPEGGA